MLSLETSRETQLNNLQIQRKEKRSEVRLINIDDFNEGEADNCRAKDKLLGQYVSVIKTAPQRNVKYYLINDNLSTSSQRSLFD